MQDQDKERFLALIVIAVIIIGALGYFLWNFVFNKGTVIFNGNPPFSVTVNDQTYECNMPSCELTIKEGSHKYRITKEGYNPLSGTINLTRGQELVINAKLTFIPTLSQPSEYTMFDLPVGYAKFKDRLNNISLFRTYDSYHDLNRLPKKINNIVFSDSGERALVFEDDQILTYKTTDYTTNKIQDFEQVPDGAFSPDENSFYIVATDQDSKKYALKKISFESGESENLVFFTRNISDYDITVSPNEKFAVLADKTGETTIMYLINLDKKARTNVFEGKAVNLGQFSCDGNYFVFKARNNDEDLASIKYLDVVSKEFSELPFESDLDVFDFAEGPVAFFVSDSEFAQRGIFVDFVEEQAEQELTVSDIFEQEIEETTETEESFVNLFRWDPVLDEYFLVADLSDYFEGSEASRIEAVKNGSEVRFLIGDMVYDMFLAEQ
jgi:hypothetical protein